MAFPKDPLDLKVELKANGVWRLLSAFTYAVEDSYTDVYENVYAGRLLWNHNRFPWQPVVIRRGAPSRGAHEPATASFRCWNEDGYLTPHDPRSPWWPDMHRKPRLRIQVEGTTVFDGRISDIRLSWPHGDLSTGEEVTVDGEPVTVDGEPVTVGVVKRGFAYADITASGVLRELGQGQPRLRSSLFQIITQSTNEPRVSDYWPMEDGTDALSITSGLLPERRPFGMSFRDLPLSSDDTLYGSEPLPHVPAGQSAIWAAFVRGDSWYAFAGFTVEMFFRVPKLPANPHTRIALIDLDTTGAANRWAVELGAESDGTAYLRVWWHDTPDSEVEVVTVAPRDTRDWQQLRFSLTPSGASTNWKMTTWTVTPGVDAGGEISGTVPLTLGVPKMIRGAVSIAPPDGVSIGHLTIHRHIPGGWMVPADTGWLGERALSRISRLAGDGGIALGWTGDSTNSAALGIQRPGGLLDLMHEAAEADGGILCERRSSPGLRARTLRSLYNQDPRFTLDASQSEIVNPFEPVEDDQATHNVVTASRIGGTSVTQTDDDSIDRLRGRYEANYDLSLASDMKVKHHAGWRLHLGTTEEPRYPEISVDFAQAPHLLTTFVTEAGPGDRIQVTNIAPQHPDATVDQIIRGWTETYEPHRATVKFNCTPYKPYVIAKWGISKYSNRWTRLRADIDATDFVFDVNSSGDWTSNPDAFPFDILIGGAERATVILITESLLAVGWAFTVVRNVNGLARAWPAGTEVTLAESNTLGL